jgi:hypothetical protein
MRRIEHMKKAVRGKDKRKEKMEIRLNVSWKESLICFDCSRYFLIEI